MVKKMRSSYIGGPKKSGSIVNFFFFLNTAKVQFGGLHVYDACVKS